MPTESFGEAALAEIVRVAREKCLTEPGWYALGLAGPYPVKLVNEVSLECFTGLAAFF